MFSLMEVIEIEKTKTFLRPFTFKIILPDDVIILGAENENDL